MDPLLISERNLSLAWASVFIEIESRPARELAPLIVSFEGLNGEKPVEEPSTRRALDLCLDATGAQSIQTVANTIFPQSLWNIAKGDRKKFFQTYMENLPTYVSMAPHKNYRGLYFARLIAFDINPKSGKKINHNVRETPNYISNQLEFIIKHCKKGVRRSMFQATLFDPARDHTASAQLGFPCLQHLTFVPDFTAGTITLNAFFATQQLFEKAYGNFLGLARLGLFMSHETRLTSNRVNCFVGIEKMDKRPRPGALLERLTTVCKEALGLTKRGSRGNERSTDD